MPWISVLHVAQGWSRGAEMSISPSRWWSSSIKLAALMGQDTAQRAVIPLPAGQQHFSLPHRPALVGEPQQQPPTSKQRETARNNAATADFGVFCQVIPK
jgi:hypothetical protein